MRLLLNHANRLYPYPPAAKRTRRNRHRTAPGPLPRASRRHHSQDRRHAHSYNPGGLSSCQSGGGRWLYHVWRDMLQWMRHVIPNTRAVRKPSAVDCFAGCGGMTEGLKAAGYNVLGAIEIDAAACEVYSLNHPEVRLWPNDVRKISAAAILKTLNVRKGELDLLGGCPPCQGFSTLRTRNGGKRVRDKKNDLIFEFQRLVLGLRPKRVMLENVPGLLTNRRLAKFKRALEAAGYIVQAKILNVVDYGVPQRRRRVVLLASRVSGVEFAKPAKRCLTVRDAIGGMPKPGKSGDPVHDLPENRAEHVRQLIRAIPRDGGSRNALPERLALACHKRFEGFYDVYGRMAWDDAAPTITTGCFNPSKGRFLHPIDDRAITMREAALLQSFRKSYKFPVNLGKIRLATLIGNALPPAFIKRHAEHLLRATSPPVDADKMPLKSQRRTRTDPSGIESAATTRRARGLRPLSAAKTM